MQVTGKANIRNRFDIVCRDIKTGKEQKYQAHNIVLDAMWSRLVNFQSFFNTIHFGTGTGTLSPARTSLFASSGNKTATTVEQVRELPTSHWMRSVVLQPAEYVGHELTEVGVAYGSTSTNLVTHAFIEDSEGNPISIVKTDTMVVTIYATIFFELGEFDSMYGGKWRWVQPLANNQLLDYLMGSTYPTQTFRVTASPWFGRGGTAPGSHGQSPNILVADWAKDVANKRVTTPVRRLGIDVGNGAIRGFGLGSSDTSGTFRGQFPIPGVFTGHTIEGEAVGVGDGETAGFDLAWTQAQGIKVYIDGVEAENVTTDPVGEDVTLLLEDLEIEGADMSPALWGRVGSVISTRGRAWLNLSLSAEIASQVTKIDYKPGNASVLVSISTRANGGSDWTVLLENKSTGVYGLSIPDGHTQFRVELYNSNSTNALGVNSLRFLRDDPAHQITFATPPVAGAIITADYTVPYIPKDEYHVLDLQCAIQWGEG